MLKVLLCLSQVILSHGTKNTKLETGYYQETVCHTSDAQETVIQA